MTTRLDDAVDAASEALVDQICDPRVLMLLGTGPGTLAGALGGNKRVALHEVPGVPRPWQAAELVGGSFGSVDAWVIEDAPGDLEFGEGGAPIDPAWTRAFPVWLAAALGATVCVVTSAGGGLGEEARPGELILASDHLNLSGRTPLEGMGETRLGPLFPDQSELLHPGLRECALSRAQANGIPLREGVVAGTLGPALATPAERRWYHAAGADVFVQELSSPLVACAHAGLAALALVAVTDVDDEPLSMTELIERAETAAPALEDLLVALQDDLARAAGEFEEGPA